MPRPERRATKPHTPRRLRARGETRRTLSAKPVLRLQLFGVCEATLRHLRRDVAALRRDVRALPRDEARLQRFEVSYSAPLGSTEAEQTRGALEALEIARRWIRGTLLEAMVE